MATFRYFACTVNITQLIRRLGTPIIAICPCAFCEPARNKWFSPLPFNLLTPNVNYSGRTAPLTSKVVFYIFIQQIQVLNILNMVYTLHFVLFKMQFVS